MSANSLVSYATFLEVRARRHRVVVALARPEEPLEPLHSAALAVPLTFDVETIAISVSPAPAGRS